jgi:predicted GNAT family acetyltransferase
VGDADVQVRDNPARSRYEIAVSGQLAGFTQYVPRGELVDFVHTEIDEQYEGHGLASELIRQALDDARRRGWRIAASCPFVAKFIAEHRDYQDLVA